jgi:hypothetical protein
MNSARHDFWDEPRPRHAVVDVDAPGVTHHEVVTTTDGRGPNGCALIVATLHAFATQSGRHTPWMTATNLAHAVGAAGIHDPKFEGDVQALYLEGTVRLMSGGAAGGGNFYEAMLVPTLIPVD